MEIPLLAFKKFLWATLDLINIFALRR